MFNNVHVFNTLGIMMESLTDLASWTLPRDRYNLTYETRRQLEWYQFVEAKTK